MRALPPVSYLHECFTYEKSTGLLYWRLRPIEHFASAKIHKIANTCFAGKLAGTVGGQGYRYIELRYEGEKYLIAAHWIVWAMEYGVWPTLFIDHANRDRKDNRILNLREATISENARNSTVRRESRLGVKGVRATKSGKFKAQISLNGKLVHLGTHASLDLAREAYKNAAVKNFGAFAHW